MSCYYVTLVQYYYNYMLLHSVPCNCILFYVYDDLDVTLTVVLECVLYIDSVF